MSGWDQQLIKTSRGTFEVFCKGEGTPLCVTHYYSEFNHSGDYFADSFTHNHKVYLVNLRDAGNSVKASLPYQLSMLETVFDLEAIREALELSKWNYAGHSIGGVLGVIYGIFFSGNLTAQVIVGAAARDYATFSPNCIYHPEHPQFHYMQELIKCLKRDELGEIEKIKLTKERTKLSLRQPERYHQLFAKKIHKKISATRLNFFNRELQTFDVTKKLCLSTVPKLFICGKYDVQCPLEYSVEMHEASPNSELVIFNHSNHYPFLEEAAKYKLEVDRFLQAVDL